MSFSDTVVQGEAIESDIEEGAEQSGSKVKSNRILISAYLLILHDILGWQRGDSVSRRGARVRR